MNSKVEVEPILVMKADFIDGIQTFGCTAQEVNRMNIIENL